MKIHYLRLLSYATCLLIVVINPGCATLLLRERTQEYKDYTTEFAHVRCTLHDSRPPYVCKGWYLGAVTNAGIISREYIFSGVLKGNGRNLRILVPTDVQEGVEKITDLTVQYQWNGPFVQLTEMRDDNWALTASTRARLILLYNAYSLERAQDELKEDMPDLDISRYGINTLIIGDLGDDADVAFFMNQTVPGTEVQWKALPVRQKIGWKERSRILSVLGIMSPIVTIPFDVVTFPIQWIMLCLTPIG